MMQRSGLIRLSDFNTSVIKPGALSLSFEVRGVDEDELIISRREVHVHLQNLHFIARILVLADFADSQHIGTVEKFRDERDDLPGQRHILRLLGIDAKPGEMGQAEPRGPLRLMLGQLAEIIVNPAADERSNPPRTRARKRPGSRR